MNKNVRKSIKFIELLETGKFKKPEFIKLQQLGLKNEYTKEQINREIENYNFFMNTSFFIGFKK